MRDPYSAFSQPRQAEAPRTGSGTGSEVSLQQVLRTLGTRAGVAGGTLSPEALAELAQRAGVKSASQIADLSRMLGVAGPVPDAQQQPQSILFLLGEHEFALPTEVVQGVERVGEITPVPNTVPWVLGVVQVWGAIVSVVDLRGFFDLPSQPVTPRSRLLVLAHKGMTIACVAEAVTEMRPLLTATLPASGSSAVPSWAQPYLTGATSVEGRQVLLLDAERLLFADKMHRYSAEG